MRGTRIAAIAAFTMLVAACTGGGPGTSQVRPAANAASQAAARDLKMTPANGATDANPAAGITVTAQHGTLKNVTVQTTGDAVSGALGQPPARSGTANGPLIPRRNTP